MGRALSSRERCSLPGQSPNKDVLRPAPDGTPALAPRMAAAAGGTGPLLRLRPDATVDEAAVDWSSASADPAMGRSGMSVSPMACA